MCFTTSYIKLVKLVKKDRWLGRRALYPCGSRDAQEKLRVGLRFAVFLLACQTHELIRLGFVPLFPGRFARFLGTLKSVRVKICEVRAPSSGLQGP